MYDKTCFFVLRQGIQAGRTAHLVIFVDGINFCGAQLS